MKISKNKYFRISGTLACLTFLLLFINRLDLFNLWFNRPQALEFSSINLPHARETWMNIIQNDRKIGFSHTRLAAESRGYILRESVLMRINTMGMVQNIQLKTRGRLNEDFSLADFDFNINSGRFSFHVDGSLDGDTLTVDTASAGSRRRMEIQLKDKPFLLAGITSAIAATELETGKKYTFDIFDPATMGQTPVVVEVVGKEDIIIAGSRRSATRVELKFKGTSQSAWIDKSGQVLQETGLLGIRLVKTTRQDALEGLDMEASTDLTQLASVASNVRLDNPENLTMLKYEISGIGDKRIQLDGGRQVFKDNILAIHRESLSELPDNLAPEKFQAFEKIFLRPSAFIQADHQDIRNLAQEIVADKNKPLEKIKALVDWVHRNIDKRPVLSLPDALSTLENRVGDCNEHAVLLAALSRAAGIPCRLEAGLAYLKGRFYYHAWNLVYLGRWITVDALFGQIPADVSHIRLVTGPPRQQLDILGLIGKINLKVLK